jgi:hypothetical protein
MNIQEEENIREVVKQMHQEGAVNMEIKRTIYHDTVRVTPRMDWTQYECCGHGADSLLGLLDRIARNGWELVGEVEGKIYIKKIELEVVADGSDS